MEKLSKCLDVKESKKAKHMVQEVVDNYLILRGWDKLRREEYKQKNIHYGRLCAEAKAVLQVYGWDFGLVMSKLDKLSYRADRIGCEWTIRTLIKKDLKIKL